MNTMNTSPEETTNPTIKALILDTESTGFPSKTKALDDPSQPHLVSLSALQVIATTSPTGLITDIQIQQSTSKIVYPDDWEWNGDCPAFAVHGITTELAKEIGRPEGPVLVEFLHLWKDNDYPIVAHNLLHDTRMLAITAARYYAQQTAQSILGSAGFCTMKESRSIVEAKNVKGNTKNPSLKEAYEFFTGEPLEDHHSANADALACLQIWLGINAYNHKKEMA